MKARVLSGVQPSGNLHLGNYLGALKNWAEIQGDYESIFCIVDLHAVTVYQEPEELAAKIRETAALFIAAGIDPEQSSIVVQSSVSGHAELAWMLTCVTPLGWLNRMTQFKAKSEKQETIGSGLLQYPVLMAADILLYQAKIVPVGEDQSQHLELTRDIAQRFNALYGDTFNVPETRLPAVGARILGLDDPTVKMSKSVTGANHAIALLDPPEVIRKKIARATTDSQPSVDPENMGAGVANLFTIANACDASVTRSAVAGMRYGDFKKRVAEAVVARLDPIQKKYREITGDRGYVDAVLQRGLERVLPIAQDTVRTTKRAMGLYVPGEPA
jgi:tryptophanyl-tRNA synthetase